MEPEEKKTCKMCCMEIPGKAKKCPYCQHWQYTLSLIVIHPVFGMTLAGIFFIVIFSFMATSMKEMFSKGEPLSRHMDSLTPTQTEMKFGEEARCHEGTYPTVAIIGKLENKSDVVWKDIVFETQIFNKQGKLIDTKQKEQYGFVVPAHGECSFKLSFPMEFPKAEYDSHKVFIRQAKDARARF